MSSIIVTSVARLSGETPSSIFKSRLIRFHQASSQSTRYGASFRKIKKMEVSQHSKYLCEFCGNVHLFDHVANYINWCLEFLSIQTLKITLEKRNDDGDGSTSGL
ncbi:unnamed protein product [Lactuca virosa]|uniref:Uncharacterized protein n=1 Tax=Lactuca virosa TaxID=75947 RepID=A0AAU9M279_9ASTR|nr:unnamed protein product [Lactuca virosa]